MTGKRRYRLSGDPAADGTAPAPSIVEEVLSPRVEHVTILEHITALLDERQRHFTAALGEQDSRLAGSIAALNELTNAQFLTFRTLTDGHAAQVALALTASREAIDKAEVAMTTILAEIQSRLGGRIDSLDELTGAKFVTFRTLIDGQASQVALALAASKEAITKAEAATKEAITKAEIATDKRFDSVNEFRAQQRDIIAGFARSDLMLQSFEARDAATDALSARVRDLELIAQRSHGEQAGGRTKLSDQRAAMAAYIGLATLVISVLIIAANLLTGGK